MGIVEEYENSFEYVRRIILANTAISAPLTFITMFLIVFKSPKHMQTYKFLLLNISIWAFLTDMLLEVYMLPLPLMEEFTVYITGIGRWFGSTMTLLSLIGTAFCMGQYLISLQLAFFYRYKSLKTNFEICGTKLTNWHYTTGIAFLLIVPATSMTISMIFVHVSDQELRNRLQKDHPELLPFLELPQTFGFDRIGISTLCSIVFLWVLLWIVSVFFCIKGIVKQFREHRNRLTDYTYKLHMQLFKALAIQTAAPLTLFAIPLTVFVPSLVFQLRFIDEAFQMTLMTMSLHSTVNSLAVLLLMKPYRDELRRIFRKITLRTNIVSSSFSNPS
uniref:G_PROTEIN_RECEP_F1_2 domain-containing protein n=1 Tax=Steinernema glaseri TaxID=37863 RepID=A0A1I8A8G1_9BILA